MSSQSDEATVESEETASEQDAVEQKPTEPSYQDVLLKLAKDEGMVADKKPPEASATEPQIEDQPKETEEERELPLETPAEGEDAEEKETDYEEPEEKPTAERKSIDQQIKEAQEKGEKPKWYLSRIAEQTEKLGRRNRTIESLETDVQKSQARIQELESALSQASGPQPTPQQPLVDIRDERSLERLERLYDEIAETDRTQTDEEGMVTIPTGWDKDGKVVRQKVTPEQCEVIQAKSNRILRKEIPARRAYLTSRAQIDAQTADLYPDLKETDSEFARQVAYLEDMVVSGRAQNDPEIRYWVANAIYGFRKRNEELKASNGNTTRDQNVKKIVDSSKVKVAPTAPRTRSVVERKSDTVKLAQAEKEFARTKSHESAEALIAARLARGTGSQIKRITPLAG